LSRDFHFEILIQTRTDTRWSANEKLESGFESKAFHGGATASSSFLFAPKHRK